MRRNAPPRRSSRALWPLLAIALALAFYLGRWSAPPAPPPSLTTASPAEVPECPEPTLTQGGTGTSTIGLCPCPRPRPPRMLPIAKKKKPPTSIHDQTRSDPTEATARYLREQANRLAPCAPAQGTELHVHLEVEVAPKGEVQRVKVTNLDPLPSEVSTCVEKIYSELHPPAFDSREVATFALTVVL
ncbi:MAG: hypothetical protein IPG45_07955 [Deltaproteobacteria bacterium]|nr:hypothetical protein [Deltaproteobacteria bacterium]